MFSHMFTRTSYGSLMPVNVIKPETQEEQNERIKRASDKLEAKKEELRLKRDARNNSLVLLLEKFGLPGNETTSVKKIVLEYDEAKDNLIDHSARDDISVAAQVNNLEVDLYMLEKELERAHGPKVS